MPPWRQWYVGREAIGSFLALAWKVCGGIRLVPTAANRQPAFAMYTRRVADAPWAAHAIHVLELEHETISTLTLFVEPVGPRLFDAFRLPQTLPMPRAPRCRPRRTTVETRGAHGMQRLPWWKRACPFMRMTAEAAKAD